jgi:phenylpropionate dioxygenase-like ring-hydroxylating dioxygenase large terminal subunit
MQATPLLRNCWYLAIRSRELKTGALLSRVFLGEPVVLGRGDDGKPFALRNICPHRGMPLSYGWLQGSELQCCYHGWKFNTATGQCTDIPSMSEEQDRQRLAGIKVRSYRAQEIQGNVWIFMPGEKALDEKDIPPVPNLPGIPAGADPDMAETMRFRCHMDHAVMGLMDPAHAAFVHTSWWWRTKNLQRREIRKNYGPAPWGYQMERYALTQSAKPYRILGGNVSTEIRFQLPGVRVEHITGDRHTVVSLTAITPISDGESDVHQLFYWTIPWLAIARPIARRMAHRFLAQDRDVVIMQEEGLAFDPPMMLIDDTDTQAKWYFRLKQEYEKSQEEGRGFANPVQPRTLRWRS